MLDKFVIAFTLMTGSEPAPNQPPLPTPPIQTVGPSGPAITLALTPPVVVAVAVPQMWKLADASGKEWRWHNREGLIAWVIAKNQEIDARAASVTVAQSPAWQPQFYSAPVQACLTGQ